MKITWKKLLVGVLTFGTLAFGGVRMHHGACQSANCDGSGCLFNWQCNNATEHPGCKTCRDFSCHAC